MSDDLRILIVEDVMENGGNPITRDVPRGVYALLGNKYRVNRSTVLRIWHRFCSGTIPYHWPCKEPGKKQILIGIKSLTFQSATDLRMTKQIFQLIPATVWTKILFEMKHFRVGMLQFVGSRNAQKK